MDVKTLKSMIGLSLCTIFLCACASSGVTDSAATQVDAAYANTNSFVGHLGDNGFDAYPNSSSVIQGSASGMLVGATAVGLATSTYGGALLGAAGGAVIGGVLGAYLNHHATLIEQLENHGAKVFVLGDQFMIVIPSIQVFREGTPTMFPRAGNTLDLVAQLINGGQTMAVNISVYSDGAVSNPVYLSITQQQADTVEKYLWSRVNTRLLSATGAGNAKLIDQAGSPVNSRIEITMERMPA